MSDPVAEHLASLELRLRRTELERTHQAELAVHLEDELQSLRQERYSLINCVQHLLEHLEHRALTHSCAEIHPKIKEYNLQ